MPAGANSFDHLALYCPVSILDAEITFLAAALGVLGVKEQFRVRPELVAMGDSPQNAYFWVSGITQNGPVEGPVTSVHLAFKAQDRAAVAEFHKAGLAAGGKDNGAPGIRAMYHKGYYAAFLRSPAGHNVEAVVHETVES